MENQDTNFQGETPLEKVSRNPWWVKVIPHLAIICILFNMAYYGQYFEWGIIVSLSIGGGLLIKEDIIILPKEAIPWMLLFFAIYLLVAIHPITHCVNWIINAVQLFNK